MRNDVINKQIASLADCLGRRREVAAVYLFGSRAKKNGRGWKSVPDVDVGILLDRKLARSRHFEVKFRLIRDAEKIFGEKKVDLVLLNNADPVLCHEVFSCRKILFERDAAQRVEFEARRQDAYFDFLPYQEFFARRFFMPAL